MYKEQDKKTKLGKAKDRLSLTTKIRKKDNVFDRWNILVIKNTPPTGPLLLFSSLSFMVRWILITHSHLERV